MILKTLVALLIVSFPLSIVGSSLSAQQPEISNAIKYLDQRESDWFDWQRANRGDTKCISCHTNVTYAISRRQIGRELENDDLTVYKDRLLANTQARVKDWKNIKLFFGGSRSDQSRGTEAVLNALILANDDQQADRNKMSRSTVAAMEHLWAEQIREGDNRGSWHWLDFGLQPWESGQARFYGATIAAIAVGKSPGNYAERLENKNRISLLRKFLLGKYGSESVLGDSKLPLYHKTYLVWASNELSGLLNSEQQAAILKKLFETQNDDGGWDLAGLGGWKRNDESETASESDGYATGLVVFIALKAKISRDTPNIKRAIAWLQTNLDQDSGTWVGISPNQDRTRSSERVKSFMTDAATSLAALALSEYGKSVQE